MYHHSSSSLMGKSDYIPEQHHLRMAGFKSSQVMCMHACVCIWVRACMGACVCVRSDVWVCVRAQMWVCVCAGVHLGVFLGFQKPLAFHRNNHISPSWDLWIYETMQTILYLVPQTEWVQGKMLATGNTYCCSKDRKILMNIKIP